MATLSVLRANVQRELQDALGVYYPAALVDDLLNEGVQLFAEQTRCLRATASINVVSGQAEYSLSAVVPGALEVLSVYLPMTAGSTDERPLQMIDQGTLEGLYPNWRTEPDGTPIHYMRWGQGLQVIRLFPGPNTGFTAIIDAPSVTFDALYGSIHDVVGLTDAQFDSLYGSVSDVSPTYGGMRVNYVARAVNMVANGDTPSIPEEYHGDVVFYALARACEHDTAIAQVQKAPMYRAKFDEAVKRARGLVDRGMQRKPASTTVLQR